MFEKEIEFLRSFRGTASSEALAHKIEAFLRDVQPKDVMAELDYCSSIADNIFTNLSGFKVLSRDELRDLLFIERAKARAAINIVTKLESEIKELRSKLDRAILL